MMGRINSWLAKGDRWVPAVFFCCVLGLYLTMLSHYAFVDETDVFYGGYNIIKSGDLYRFYPSQHMPFSYYFAAPGALLGARTIWQFRLYFHVLLSGLWTGMYIRYRKHFSRLALMLLPVFFVFQLHMHDLATTMVSDHWQGIGLVIILLELLWYADTKKITGGMACMVSLGIVLSFGTAFLSAYPLLVIFLGVLATQAVLAVKKERELSALLREDGRLTLVCLCPFALLALWYAVSGNLGNAVGGAYELNVNIYSRYLGGFGTEPGGTFFDVFPKWIAYQAKALDYLRGGSWRWALQILLQTVSLLVLVAGLFVKKKKIAGITFLLAAILAGVRTFDGFHGAPYMAVTCIPMALCADGALEFFLVKKSWRRASPAALALALTLALLLPGAGVVRNLKYVPRLVAGRTYRESNRDVLAVLAEPGETIHTDDLSYSAQTVMAAGLSLDEASLGAGNPWFYEFYGERELNSLKANKTRLLVMDPEGELWGYDFRDYAADLVAYAEENYTNIGPNLYVRNDAYPAALEKLRAAGYGTKYDGPSFWAENSVGPRMTESTVYDQRITAAGSRMTGVLVRLATYLDQNTAGATVRLLDEAGNTVAESTLPKEEIKDNIYTRFALRAETVPGAAYTLRITSDGTSTGDAGPLLALYCYTEGTGAVLDGEAKDYCWAVVAEYDAEE